MNISNFIKRHSLLTYIALTFVISWGGMLLVIGGPSGILSTMEQVRMLLPFAILAMLPGPSMAGILLVGLVHGRAGLREFVSRLLGWRVGARWYAVALVTAPLAVMTTLFALSLTSPVFLPGIFTSHDKASLVLSGIVGGLAVGIFEEIGWTGFALPRLRRRYGVLSSGIILGFLWGAWHFPLSLWGSFSPSGALSLSLFLPEFLFYVAVLPTYRVLMAWIYDRTGSLPVAMLMHACLSASVPLILMPPATGMPLLSWYLVLAAALWVVIAAVAMAHRGRPTRQPLRRQVG